MGDNNLQNAGATGAATTGAGATGAGTTGADSNETFESFLVKQPKTVQDLYSAHVTGLKNTVAATRRERDELSGQIKDLTKSAEKGSELEKQLTVISQKLEVTERKSDFMEQAMKPEIGCRNPVAAYALATVNGLFNNKGVPDWTTIKSMAPELFGKEVPKGHGGEGTGGSGDLGKLDMNALIRHKAGRG